MIVKKYETLLKNYGGNCKCALINPAKYMKGQLYETSASAPTFICNHHVPGI